MKTNVLLLTITSASLFLFAGCSDNTTQLGNGTQQEKSSQNLAQENASTQTNSSSANTKNSSDAPTKQLALAEIIALYQKEKPDTDITSIEIDTQMNNLIYEVKGMDDNKEYKVIFSASGDIQHQEEEMLDNDERNGVERKNEKLDLKDLLPMDKINSIANKEVSGDIVEWSLEREMATTYWEVTINNGKQSTSVSIDALSGNVLEVETDD